MISRPGKLQPVNRSSESGATPRPGPSLQNRRAWDPSATRIHVMMRFMTDPTSSNDAEGHQWRFRFVAQAPVRD